MSTSEGLSDRQRWAPSVIEVPSESLDQEKSDSRNIFKNTKIKNKVCLTKINRYDITFSTDIE